MLQWDCVTVAVAAAVTVLLFSHNALRKFSRHMNMETKNSRKKNKRIHVGAFVRIGQRFQASRTRAS